MDQENFAIIVLVGGVIVLGYPYCDSQQQRVIASLPYLKIKAQ